MRINQIIGDYQFDGVCFVLFETIDYVCVINHSNINYDPEGNMFISKWHWTYLIIAIPGIGVIPYFIYK
jgi:hypothetical protein